MSAARLRNLPDHRVPIASALSAMGVPELCAALGIERSRSERGRWSCPRHGGGSLSVKVKEGQVFAFCHGCGEVKGDAFALVAAAYGLNTRRDFRKVLDIAASIAGVRLDEGKPFVPAPRPPRRVAPTEPEKPQLDIDIFDRIASTMLARGPLPGDDEVASYLEKRKLLDLTVEAGWGALPATPQAQKVLFDELVALVGLDAMKASGLADSSGRGFRDQAHRLLIPWRTHDVDGLVQTLQRRVVAGEGKYMMPIGRVTTSPFVVVDDLEELEDSTPIALTEGAIDTLVLRAHLRSEGIPALVMGLPGVHSWRTEWSRLLANRHVRIAFDDDKAGNEEAPKMLARCKDAGALTVKRWQPDGAEDWAEARVKSS